MWDFPCEKVLFKLLNETKTSDILKGKKKREGGILTLNHSTTIGDALEDMATARVLSVPVVLAPSLEDSDEGQYMGMIDCNDILRAIVRG